MAVSFHRKKNYLNKFAEGLVKFGTDAEATESRWIKHLDDLKKLRNGTENAEIRDAITAPHTPNGSNVWIPNGTDVENAQVIELMEYLAAWGPLRTDSEGVETLMDATDWSE